MLSARNKFQGLIKSVEHGKLMTEVVIAAGDFKIVSIISRHSAHDMNLREGDKVTAIIKATNVLIEKS